MSKDLRSALGLDDVDQTLLAALIEDGRLANNRLAARAGVAASTALLRVRQLIDRGVIRGVHADIAPGAVGRPVEAIVAIRLRAHDRRHIDAFTTTVPRLPEVLQSFHVAGDDDYLLHVAVPSAAYLRDWILDQVTTHPAVAHSRTSLVFGHEPGHPGPLPT
ncbi:Lrp/AsnC family transcriptional regulator [Nostocoides jenkinsii]|jgi:DNA-binding Lrp family transcriptional regulator|uniref:Transcriptional regulator, AsnC family n=1 Tax=Nostocoides jenkinsii Ben 74 TaxID=1193518 RepID=A0A077MD03_9MICO|nr:Lrp/AsnC family transcriptional regulator [Tetrasphaera jenkinsii]CCI53755.1 Transcriptional regulator, AsnC family [Tetrasphaera jenkinsii Ben 74]